MQALPDHGKVILSELVVPEEGSISFTVLAHGDGGMERTKDQWTKLLGDAGFARIQFVQLSSRTGFDQWLI
jgi:hypothetical protein